MKLNKKVTLGFILSLLVINFLGFMRQVQAAEGTRLPIDVIVVPKEIKDVTETFKVWIENQNEESPLPESNSGQAGYLPVKHGQDAFFDWSELPPVGIYSYKIYQEAGSTKGVKYDDTVYLVDLVVQRDVETDEIVSTFVVKKQGIEEKVSKITFTNEFPPPVKNPPKFKEKLPETGERQNLGVVFFQVILLLSGLYLVFKTKKL